MVLQQRSDILIGPACSAWKSAIVNIWHIIKLFPFPTIIFKKKSWFQKNEPKGLRGGWNISQLTVFEKYTLDKLQVHHEVDSTMYWQSIC